MAKLLKEDKDSSLRTRIGGSPQAAEGFAWPICRECSGPMQFVAQIDLGETDVATMSNRQQLLLIFQCQTDPGMCDDWDADSGANCGVLVSTEGSLPEVQPPDGPTTLDAMSPVSVTAYDDSAMDESPDDAYLAEAESNHNLLGKTGGRPLWIQGDETPSCQCGKAMTFVGQLEDRGGGGINFGDVGAGYAFVCEGCPSSAKFLWQCS